MNIALIRSDARQTLQHAKVSPFLVTACFLAILYAVLICYNVFTIWYSYAIDASPGGLDAMNRVGRYYTFATVSPILVTLFSNSAYGLYSGYTLSLSRDANADLRTLLQGFRLLGKLLFLTLLISFFTFLWACLFVFPGFIAIYRYRLSYHILFDHPEYSAFQALEESKRMTYGHKLDLFMLDLSFFYFYLLAFGGNIVMNFPFYYPLENPGMAADLKFFLLGTVLIMVGEFLFLPHLRTSLTQAYLSILEEDTSPADGSGPWLPEP